MSIYTFVRSLVLPLSFVAGLLSLMTVDAAAKETILYTFCKSGCSDGSSPQAAVISDSAGNLYGTTPQGGTGNYGGRGVVFKLTPGGTESVLYSFCSLTACTDGNGPSSSVLLEGGNLYGTTPGGGNKCPAPLYSCGLVYAVTPSATENIIYTFCAKRNCADGAQPEGSVITDGPGRYVGVTAAGGVSSNCLTPGGCGTVYAVTSRGRERVLYSFCAQSSCADGAYPQSAPVRDALGNYYGTAPGNGANGHGVAYELVRHVGATKTTWSMQVLYSFCAQTNCTDGSYPNSSLVMDKNGNLYGTTPFGGSAGVSAIGGTVFELSPPTDGSSTWSYKVLHSFTNGPEGSNPHGSVIIGGANGDLYGTTSAGGASYGAVYRLAVDGTVTVLHTFALSGDGATPMAGLMQKDGYLYGTTSGGGNAPVSYGTVFKLPK